MRNLWSSPSGLWVSSVILATLVGCDTKTQQAPPALEVGPAALDFGIVPMGSASAADITLANTGGGEVAVLSVSLTEGDPDLWIVDRNDLQTVPGGTEGAVTITFRPEDLGILETGQIQIRTDLPEEGTFYVSLSGVGGASADDYDQDGYSAADGDCDDGDPSRYPGADEICDGRDNDCDGDTPSDEDDGDYDGWRLCEQDCDDGNGQVYPGAPEICDYLDNDCDQQIPDEVDADLDGYSICGLDCDDALPNVNPGRPEVCDGLDNDCDGGNDNVDADLDGHTLCSAAGDCDDNDPTAYPIVVAPGGSPYGTGTDALPLDTVQNGLDHLDAVCRTLVLEPGTYSGVAVDWFAGDVAIVGRTGDASDVTLEAAAYDRHLTIDGGAVTLRDLTLTGGDPTGDGGAVHVANATVTLDGVVLSGNASGNDGGALAATSATVILAGAVFDGNTAYDDGGALAAIGSTVVDDGSLYLNNVAVLGGAMYLGGGDVTLDAVEVRGNSADEGGGIAIDGSGSYDLERSWLVLNHANADGGALALREVSANGGQIRNNRIQDNSADGAGGAIAVLGTAGAGRIANNTLTGNVAVGLGGGILVDVTNGAAVVVSSNVLHSNDGPSAVYVAPGAGSSVAFNTAYLTNSGVHFAGDIVDAYGAPLDPTNVVRNPLLVAVSDDGNPDNDDLQLGGGSPEIDAGDPAPENNDVDGSLNDRGFTGGPAAP